MRFDDINLPVRKLVGLFAIHRRFACVCGFAACISKCPALNAQNWEPIKPRNGIEELAPYLGSPWEHIDVMLQLAKFKIGDSVLDLGAGDGRVLIRALQLGASRVEGWELSKDVYDVGVEHIQAVYSGSKLDMISFYNDDALKSNPLKFDIVTLFLLPYGLGILSPWLAKLWNDEHLLKRNTKTKIISQGWPLILPPSSILKLQSNIILPSSGTHLFMYSA